MTKKDLRSIATAPLAGFRHETVTVAEWGGVVVMLREPSAPAWMRSISHIKTEEEPGDVSDIETRITSNTMADVVLFVDVLLDEAGARVFSDKDADTLICSYGPVHSRLLRQALALSKSDIEDAEKK
ncbi:phage tail protein [Yersinia similis]|uniref:Phage tail protein n=1 Tax=Yersinia similis TaxID=367190 RepID=A0ABN4CPR9_9GAMM|nr:phage tail assembly chaperone [Yersinia similis]AHK20373.1 phage tail protein [Yersinia similis]CFQ72180.1 Phage tail assembly chaperone [Yersinia similis]